MFNVLFINFNALLVRSRFYHIIVRVYSSRPGISTRYGQLWSANEQSSLAIMRARTQMWILSVKSVLKAMIFFTTQSVSLISFENLVSMSPDVILICLKKVFHVNIIVPVNILNNWIMSHFIPMTKVLIISSYDR